MPVSAFFSCPVLSGAEVQHVERREARIVKAIVDVKKSGSGDGQGDGVATLIDELAGIRPFTAGPVRQQGGYIVAAVEGEGEFFAVMTVGKIRSDRIKVYASW
jgi:hypothetical protein